jgi:DNA polymerase
MATLRQVCLPGLRNSLVSEHLGDSRIRAAVQHLESLRAAGMTHLPKAAAVSATTAASPTPTAPPADLPEIMPKKAPARSLKPAVALAELQKQVAACTRCSELASTRTQTVFGVGDPESRLMFLGEAPGADEDALGEPFVGRAGKLLTDIIEKGMGLKRSEVYICNILRCRPPGNRNPLPIEAAACREFLDAQVAIVKPEFICCLGTIAAHNLLNETTPIGKLRGRFLDYQGIKVLCTYHPAYVLRNPPAKKQVWEDIQILMKEMGLKVAKKAE